MEDQAQLVNKQAEDQDETFRRFYSIPVPKILNCPSCGFEHIDGGIWASIRKHKTHLCQNCKTEWRPYEFYTVGVPSDSLAVKNPQN